MLGWRPITLNVVTCHHPQRRGHYHGTLIRRLLACRTTPAFQLSPEHQGRFAQGGTQSGKRGLAAAASDHHWRQEPRTVWPALHPAWTLGGLTALRLPMVAANLSGQNLDRAERPPSRRVPTQRTGALLEKVVRRPVARPACPGPVAGPEQKEAGECQPPCGL